ncbi:MAG: hypothetical protein ACI857_000700 [Arenicella sp.]|jgi:hypothetical protein
MSITKAKPITGVIKTKINFIPLTIFHHWKKALSCTLPKLAEQKKHPKIISFRFDNFKIIEPHQMLQKKAPRIRRLFFTVSSVQGFAR